MNASVQGRELVLGGDDTPGRPPQYGEVSAITYGGGHWARGGQVVALAVVVEKPWKTQEHRRWNYAGKAASAEGKVSQCSQGLHCVDVWTTFLGVFIQKAWIQSRNLHVMQPRHLQTRCVSAPCEVRLQETAGRIQASDLEWCFQEKDIQMLLL